MIIIVDSKLIAYNVGYNPDRSMIDVFEIVQNIAEDLAFKRKDKVTKIIFGFDFEKSDYRLGLWPQYKAGRVYTKMPSDFQDNYRHKLPLLARALGVDVLGVSGVECDDLAGILISNYKGNEQIICLTGDRDWIQLSLEFDNVEVYDPKQLKYLESHCTSAQEFLVEKIIKGDNSDNIHGLKFCGKACFETFLQNIKNSSNIREEFLKLATRNPRHGISDEYKKFGIDTFEKLYDFNLKLGTIMEDLSILTPTQQQEFKDAIKTFKEDHRANISHIQKIAAEISGNRVGIFGDPLVIPEHQLQFYRSLKD